MKKGLTKRQREILEYFADKDNWRLPTYREVGEHFDIRRSTVLDHVEALIKKGYLERRGGSLKTKGTRRNTRDSGLSPFRPIDFDSTQHDGAILTKR